MRRNMALVRSALLTGWRIFSFVEPGSALTSVATFSSCCCFLRSYAFLASFHTARWALCNMRLGVLDGSGEREGDWQLHLLLFDLEGQVSLVFQLAEKVLIDTKGCLSLMKFPHLGSHLSVSHFELASSIPLMMSLSRVSARRSSRDSPSLSIRFQMLCFTNF
jgi:hypothetical protein